MPMDPATFALIMAAAGAAQGGAASISAAGNSKRSAQIAREELQERRRARQQSTALTESGMNPFRHQLDQANAMSSLDQLENATYAPTRLAAPSRYAGSVPRRAGGFSYERSPEIRAGAGALKRNVMGGNTAPTQTDPANYGQTGALDLLSLGGTDPGRPRPNTRPRDLGAYLEGADRRIAGKSFSAETRGTDVSAMQARQILDRVIRTELGRIPQPGEIDQMLAGQGLAPGGQWVGEAGLSSIIQILRQQAAPAQPLA